MKKIFELISLFLFLFSCLFVVYYNYSMSGKTVYLIEMCIYVIIPSLFPFIILTRIFSSLGIIENAGKTLSFIISPLFGVEKSLCGAFLTGIICGFPNGAISASEIYNSGKCTKLQAEKTIALSNNCSLPFILSVAGVCSLGSIKNGLILVFSEILSVFVLSLYLRIFYKDKNTDGIGVQINVKKTQESGFIRKILYSIKDGAKTMFYICSYILVFGIISSCTDIIFTHIYPLQFLFKTIFEVTSAVNFSGIADFPLNVVLTSASLGFSGLSVIMQVTNECQKCNLSPSLFIKSRFINAVLMPVFTIFLLMFLPREAIYTFNTYSYYTITDKEYIFRLILVYSAFLFAVIIMFGIMYLLSLFLTKRNKDNT